MYASRKFTFSHRDGKQRVLFRSPLFHSLVASFLLLASSLFFGGGEVGWGVMNWGVIVLERWIVRLSVWID